MNNPFHPEGIYRCEGCGHVYSEYVNGCVIDHYHDTGTQPPSRRVALIIPETETS